MMEGSPQGIAIEMLREIAPVRRLLDVGCGNGNIAEQIKGLKLVQEIYGVDIDEKLLGEAKKKGMITSKVDLEKERLPFPDSFFDVILCIDVIEHIVNIYHLLSEIRRTLRTNGCLIISTPNIQFIYHIIRLILGYGPKTSFDPHRDYYRANLYDGGHIHYFTIKDLRSLLVRHHFKILTVRGTYNVSKKILKRILKVVSDNPLLLQWLCPGFVIKAQAV